LRNVFLQIRHVSIRTMQILLNLPRTERQEFINYIAANPEAGDIIRESGGCRKVRWSRPGTGKRGGVRVIYFLAPDGTVWLLIVYSKAKFDNLPASFLAQLKKGIEDAI
jgi:hypothetical protein